MRIIAKKRLLALAERHAECVPAIRAWYAIAKKDAWHNLADVRRTFPHADAVGDRTVFNIKGNDYRLIVGIDYEHGIIYVKDLLTHAEYDKGRWKST